VIVASVANVPASCHERVAKGAKIRFVRS